MTVRVKIAVPFHDVPVDHLYRPRRITNLVVVDFFLNASVDRVYIVMDFATVEQPHEFVVSVKYRKASSLVIAIDQAIFEQYPIDGL